MSPTNDLEETRDEFWARRAAERQRRSSARSQASNDLQLARPPWVHLRNDADFHRPVPSPVQIGGATRSHYQRPRAMSNTLSYNQGTEAQMVPLRTYRSQQDGHGSFGRTRAISAPSQREQNINLHRSSNHSNYLPVGRRSENMIPAAQIYNSTLNPYTRNPSVDGNRRPSRDSADYNQLQQWQSSASRQSDWDRRTYGRRHRSLSSVSRSTRTVEDVEEDLREMHPTRAFLRDKKDEYIHEKPMEYPRSSRRAAEVAVGGVAGALGVAGATEASKHASTSGFDDVFDCGFCDCLGIFR